MVQVQGEYYERKLHFTRRPASTDRTARRQFQANGQPVSRTQADDVDFCNGKAKYPPYFYFRFMHLCDYVHQTELSVCFTQIIAE